MKFKNIAFVGGLVLVAAGGMFVFGLPALALDFTPQVDIGVSGEVNPNMVGEFIKKIYIYALGAVGVIATVVMMYGGVLWITAGGNQERVGQARNYIAGALAGLVLLLSSYTILYFVNPQLISFRPLDPRDIAPPEAKTGCPNGCPPYSECKPYPIDQRQDRAQVNIANKNKYACFSNLPGTCNFTIQQYNRSKNTYEHNPKSLKTSNEEACVLTALKTIQQVREIIKKEIPGGEKNLSVTISSISYVPTWTSTYPVEAGAGTVEQEEFVQ